MNPPQESSPWKVTHLASAIERLRNVDPRREAALLWLTRIGAALVEPSAFGVYLGDRLELRRLTAAGSKTNTHSGWSTEAAHSALVRALSDFHPYKRVGMKISAVHV